MHPTSGSVYVLPSALLNALENFSSAFARHAGSVPVAFAIPLDAHASFAAAFFPAAFTLAAVHLLWALASNPAERTNDRAVNAVNTILSMADPLLKTVTQQCFAAPDVLVAEL